MSQNTVAKRITDLAANLRDQTKTKSSTFESFYIVCDESTEIVGITQLAVFLLACSEDLIIFEELYELIPMHDVFNSVFELLQKYNLPLAKFNSVAIDDTPSITGKNNGFVALLQ